MFEIVHVNTVIPPVDDLMNTHSPSDSRQAFSRTQGLRLGIQPERGALETRGKDREPRGKANQERRRERLTE